MASHEHADNSKPTVYHARISIDLPKRGATEPQTPRLCSVNGDRMTPCAVAQLIMSCHDVVVHTTNAPRQEHEKRKKKGKGRESQKGMHTSHASASACKVQVVDRKEQRRKGQEREPKKKRGGASRTEGGNSVVYAALQVYCTVVGCT